MLKYREIAKTYYKVNVGNGNSISFWFDQWSSLGCLYDVFGARGCIDLGISVNASLGDVIIQDRSRRHRNQLLVHVEEEIKGFARIRSSDAEDEYLWRSKNDVYKLCFSSKETWELMRTPLPTWDPHQGIWFSYATPKFSFITWLAARNRLTTGEPMEKWGINVRVSCSFCDAPRETREHLFFSCPFSELIWKHLAKGIMGHRYTNIWSDILNLVIQPSCNQTTSFIIRYVFQSTIHAIWCERNNRRHGKQPTPYKVLIKTVDINIRNRLSTMKREDTKNYEDALRVWFASKRS